jgi:hypothetical protein
MPTEFSSFGAAWKANNALGGGKIFLPRPGLTGLEIASDLIGRGFQTCKGKFAPARSSELVDSMSCSELLLHVWTARMSGRLRAIAEFW